MNTLKLRLRALLARAEVSVLIAVILLGLLFSVSSANFLSSYNIYPRLFTGMT